MDTCYVIARSGVSGGTGTLSYRLLSYLHDNNYKCAYLCCENNAPQQLSLIQSVVDDIVIDKDSSYQTQYSLIENKYDNFVFLTYSVDEYLFINRIRRRTPKIVRSFLYVVHYCAFSVPDTLNLHPLKRRVLKFFVKLKYRRLVKSLVLNNSILFMDDPTVQETSRSLNIYIKDGLVFFLPYVINHYPDDYWSHLAKHNPFTIGTMCRMEFPFKGYVLGLIDNFVRLNDLYDLRLIIVGGGADETILLQKLNGLPHVVQSKIEYIKSIPYSKVSSFYSKCDLVLGMGTMLLDAANNNVLALPVRSYSNCLHVGDLFLNNINCLGMKGKEKDFVEVVEHLVSMSDSDYFKLVREQYILFKSSYDIDTFINQMTHSKIGSYRLKWSDIIVNRILSSIR